MTKSILLAGIFVWSAAAQPPVIRVIRSGSAPVYSAGKATTNVIGLSAVSGPLENWLLELHDSFASLEDLEQAIGDVALPNGVLPPPRAFIGKLLPGLSYRPERIS